jgi:uncharacterized membrane protein
MSNAAIGGLGATGDPELAGTRTQRRRVDAVLRWVLALVMIGAGVMHFVRPAFYVALIPPSWPLRLAAVYISGAAEIALGAGLLIPRWRRWAAWGIIALLVAVFPANIYHAASGGLTHPDLPAFMANATAAWLRLPVQFVLLAWAWRLTRA